MVKQIILKNFQSHKRSKIDLSGGVNLIVGSSNSGKTAVLRALRWLVFNRPVGADYLSSFANDKGVCSVKVVLDDGSVVERVRSGKENKYIVNGSEFKALKSAVPKEVSSVLKFDDLNFQHQHDGYFIVGDKPGDIAKSLNKLVWLDVAQEIVKFSKKLLDGKKREIKIVENEIYEVEEKLEEIIDIDKKISKYYSNLNKYIDRYQELGLNIQTLQDLLDNIDAISDHLSRYLSLSQIKVLYEELLHKRTELDEVANSKKNVGSIIYQHKTIVEELKKLPDMKILKDYLDKLSVFITRQSSLKHKINEIETIIRQFTQVEKGLEKIKGVESGIKLFKRYETKYNKLTKVRQNWDNLSSIVDKYDDCHTKILSMDKELKELNQIFYKEAGGICPLCKQPLPKHI